MASQLFGVASSSEQTASALDSHATYKWFGAVQAVPSHAKQLLLSAHQLTFMYLEVR